MGVDGVVLVLHNVNERRAFVRAALAQARPDVLIFSRVVSTQRQGHQGNVVGDKRGALPVTGRDRPDKVRHQPEFTAEHRVDHEHVTRIGERLVHHHHFPFPFSVSYAMVPSGVIISPDEAGSRVTPGWPRKRRPRGRSTLGGAIQSHLRIA
jgi:hypothetical protein